MNQPKKLPPVKIDSEGILSCPVCGDQYLHHREVESGWRPEDGDLTRHISNREGMQTDEVPASNITYGYRRHYVVVRLWCEFCGDGFELQLRQHKGVTILTWVKVGDPEAKEEMPAQPDGWC